MTADLLPQNHLVPQNPEPKTFEEKLKERIKDSIGDLMSDEDLSKIVDRGIQAAFFEKQRITDRWGATTEHEPLITAVVKSILYDRVKDEVTKWFEEHPTEVMSIINNVIRDGITKVVLNGIDSKLHSSLITLQSNIMQSIKTVI